MNKLEAVGISCVRGNRRLFQDLSFDLTGGRLLWVAGPNGSGKTSLLRILTGLARSESGAVRWDGVEVRDLGEAYRAQLVYLGHAAAIKDDLSALENLHQGVLEQGLVADREALLEALRRFGLGGREDLPARVLSQGQRRRVALSRLALGLDRALWILDEPFNALDDAAVALVRDCLDRHLAYGGLVVLTSHQEVRLWGMEAQRLDL